MEEIWKDIVGYEGLYQVSNFGRVKSLDRMVRVKPPKARWALRKIPGKELCPFYGRNGYAFVQLNKEGKAKGFLVHRLVAQAFIPNPGKKAHVDHINGDKSDCQLDNLRWATPQENELWKVKRLRKERGEIIYHRSLHQCHKVRNIDTGEVFPSVAAAARAIGAQAPNIAAVCLGYRGCHTIKGYHWEYVD